MKSLAIFVTCPHNPLASVLEIAPLVNKKMPYFCDCFHTEIIFFKLFIWTTLNNHWGLGSHKLLDKLIPEKYIQIVLSFSRHDSILGGLLQGFGCSIEMEVGPLP